MNVVIYSLFSVLLEHGIGTVLFTITTNARGEGFTIVFEKINKVVKTTVCGKYRMYENEFSMATMRARAYSCILKLMF